MNNPVVFNNGIFFCHGFANLLTFIVNVNQLTKMVHGKTNKYSGKYQRLK